MKTIQKLVLVGFTLGLSACNFSPHALAGGDAVPMDESKEINQWACQDFALKQTSQTRDPDTNCSELGDIDEMLVEFFQGADSYTFSLGWLQGREKIEFDQMPVVKASLNGKAIEQTLNCTKTDLDSPSVSTRYVCKPTYDQALSSQPRFLLTGLSLKNASCKTTAAYGLKFKVEDRSLCPAYKYKENLSPDEISYSLNETSVQKIQATFGGTGR